MAETQHTKKDTDNQTDGSESVAEQRRKALQHEKYVYHGKVYSYRRLYEGSRVKLVIFIMYSVIVLGLILGVLWYTYITPSGSLENIFSEITSFFRGLME